MLIQKHILVFIFSCLVINGLLGQPTIISGSVRGTKKERSLSKATTVFNSIKDGVLLVKIPTGSKKITSIKNEIARLGSSNRLEKIRNNEIERVAKAQKGIMEGFQKFYSFSPFIGVYDTNYTKVLKNPSIRGVFFNAKFEKQDNFTLEGKRFATFREDQYFYDEYRATEGYAITDMEGNIATLPFPYGIPHKFKRFPLMEDYRGDIFGLGNTIRKSSKAIFHTRYSWRKLDRNPYYAVVKLLQLKMEIFEIYVGKQQK